MSAAIAGLPIGYGQTISQPYMVAKMTELADGTRRIIDQPPLIMHFEELAQTEQTHRLFTQYAHTLEDDRRTLVDRFDVLDVARKVVGVGSVGTRCVIVLLAGRDIDDPLPQLVVLGPLVVLGALVVDGHRALPSVVAHVRRPKSLAGRIRPASQARRRQQQRS